MRPDGKIRGRWQDIRIPQKQEIIEASYDRIKDFEMDPQGYFLVKVDSEINRICVGFCDLHKNIMLKRINGYTALDIINTLVREKLVSSLQHAGDLGIELHKAEIALRNGVEYVQDQDLNLDGTEG